MSWIKVAQGFRMVAQAASKIAIEEGSNVAAAASRHGIDLAKNAKSATAQATAAAAAAAMNVQQHHVAATKKPQFTRDDNHGNFSSVGTSTSSLPIDEVGEHLENDTEEQHESMARINHNDDNGNDSNLSYRTKVRDENIGSYQNQPLYADATESDIVESKVESNDSYVDDDKNNAFKGKQNQEHEQQLSQNHHLKEGKAVPSTRIGRAMGFASLGVGLAAGTAFELASRMVSRVSNSTDNDSTSSTSNNENGSVITNDANSDRLARTLCRMRGAALKLGQMLSIQDETLLPPALSRALEQVRQGADAMPLYQLQGMMEDEFGNGWKDRFISFDEVPFAAASIGQVHRASISISPGNESDGMSMSDQKEVVVKCQYPGVANSIESDLNNLSMIVKMTGMVPPGLFIDEVIRVGRNELIVECNYLLEAENQKRFRDLVEGDEELSQAKFKVPSVIDELTTPHVITSEYCPGGTIDKVAFLDQEERNRIGRNILRLTMKELFVWRFMQTDPNWGNFLYDVGTGTTYLIDFGSAREYSKSFVDGYLRIVWASANQETDTLMAQSHLMGFLTGEENEIMLNAHKMSGFTVGEPFASDEVYDFGQSGITGRISEHGSHFLRHRLTAPPEEVYTLHRKLAGAYNLCIRLGAKIKCRDLLEEIVENYQFEDGQNHPLRKDI